jgi:REP element-mobilizing transposase RayT
MTAVATYAMSKPRLSRLSQLYIRPPVYFVTLCTFDRKMILNSASSHSVFVRFCDAASEHGFYVGRYVLMPDHIHLFVTSSQEGLDLSAWIKSLKNTLSKSWRASAVAAPHWQKGFFDHLLRATDSYGEKWAYVAANPMRASLVTAAEDWPYQGIVHDLEGVNFRRS